MPRHSDNQFYITRQSFFPEGNLGVEISQGRDSASPGAYVKKYPNEFTPIQDPRDAVEYAIQILKLWKQDGARGVKLYIAGYAPQFGIYGDNPTTFSDARAWGVKKYESMPKCARCNEIMGDEKWRANDWDGLEYCSERCAERAVEWEQEQEFAEENQE